MLRLESNCSIADKESIRTVSLRGDQQQRNRLMPEQREDSLPSFISKHPGRHRRGAGYEPESVS